MIPSRGFVRTSATGARFRPTPAARRPAPLIRSSSRTWSGPEAAITAGHGGAKSAFTFETSPPSSSSIARIGWPRHVLWATPSRRVVSSRRLSGSPPKFGVNRSTPPMWLFTRTGRTSDQSTAPRHDSTITEPMSASRSHDSGRDPKDCRSEDATATVRWVVGSWPIVTRTESSRTTDSRPTWTGVLPPKTPPV